MHRLGPGDVLDISVNAMPELTRTVRLFADGTLDLPGVGTVRAGGLTVSDLTDRLTTVLKKELRQPQVSILLREVYRPAPARVTVLGAVQKRGEIEWPEPKPLRALLAQATPTEAADLSRILIRAPDGSERQVDFSQFLSTGQAAGDLLLTGGEEVVVLERPSALKPDDTRVTVLGAVAKPGSVAVTEGATILDALEKAGGAGPGADLERVTVKGPAHPEPLVVNVARFLGGDTAAGYRLRAGDEVVVPEQPLRVLVVGEVQKPGEYAIGENTRLLDVFLKVGTTPAADPTRAEWIRHSDQGKPESHSVNLIDMVRGKSKENPVLANGDVLFLPGKQTQKRTFWEYLGMLAIPISIVRSFVGY
jgi:polysaccharide export outer membrane protein